jgi:hypothetical protein
MKIETEAILSKIYWILWISVFISHVKFLSIDWKNREKEQLVSEIFFRP